MLNVIFIYLFIYSFSFTGIVHLQDDNCYNPKYTMAQVQLSHIINKNTKNTKTKMKRKCRIHNQGREAANRFAITHGPPNQWGIEKTVTYIFEFHTFALLRE